MASKKQKISSGYLDFKPYKKAKGEEYMSAGQRAHFRQVLENWKAQLLSEADRTMHTIQAETKSYPDDADRASQEEGFGIKLRTRDRERKLIKKIDHTLNLINSDGYGYCEFCDQKIGIRRLEARPTATLCIDCKTLEESKEKHLLD